MTPKRKPNPNQKVVRVHSGTLLKMQETARIKELSVPDLIDEMYRVYILLHGTWAREDGINVGTN